MFDLKDTICAICTPQGTSAIAVIRISGKDSWDIVQKFFSETLQPCNLATLQSLFEHMHAKHGYIKEGKKIIDEVVILPFKSPKSFTTEDSIEIYCHGSPQIASMILDLCLKNGARRAEAGEFTYRAFINGRIDLTQAEAINEVISATSTKVVYAISEGALSKKVKGFYERLFDLITSIESSIEFPSDVPSLDKEKIIFELLEISKELSKLIEASREGQILRNGIKVSIIGEPNVGKSSLLNQLLESERAIVTSEPGTTRDTIEEKIILDGWPFVLVDTAGLRKEGPLNMSEKIGIKKSKEAIENSDIVLSVFDLTRNKNEEICNFANGKQKIIVGNKIDLIEANHNLPPCDISISAKYGTNIDRLKKLLLEKAISLKPRRDALLGRLYVNQRQKELLLQCSSHINSGLKMFQNNMPEDLVADELKNAVLKLDEVSGRKINEDVITNIFKKFCIGK
ncbi:MAG: tRNA uridine-5-carboxymethylaminomethyl(34) synthesis GTPase MnmE [Candidatus Melainabacteria bacterium]|nr:tRNA uridine-5-carboxymethylaminomethyl(34) synthesis GTPase MnmE [Candidatus Melainabacteria bacterium]